MTQTVSSQGIKCCWGRQKKLDARVSQAEIAGIYNSLANVYDPGGKIWKRYL